VEIVVGSLVIGLVPAVLCWVRSAGGVAQSSTNYTVLLPGLHLCGRLTPRRSAL
jgi:hypothetical protein